MRLNTKFLVVIVAITILAGVGVFFIHRYQSQRFAGLSLELARTAVEEEDVGEAVKQYRNYLAEYPDDGEVAAELGILLSRLDNPRRAYMQLEKALRLDPYHTEARDAQIRSAIRLGRYDDALDLIENEPNAAEKDSPERLWLKASAFVQKGEFNNALPPLEESVSAAPDNAQYVKDFAKLIADKVPSRLEDAVARLDALVEASGDKIDGYLARGRWYLDRAREEPNAESNQELLQRAWNDVLAASAIAGQDAKVALLAIEVAGRQGEPSKAEELAENALSANPDSPELYLAISQLAVVNGEPDKAIEWLEKGRDRLPENGDIRWNLSRILLRQGNFDAVRENLASLNKLEYPRGPIRFLEAGLLMHDEKWAEAARLLEDTRSVLDRSLQLLAEVDAQLAVCYRKMGQTDQEAAALRRIVSANPSSLDAKKALAGALSRMGRGAEAAQMYEQLMRIQGSVELSDLTAYTRLQLQASLGEEVREKVLQNVESMLAQLGDETRDSVQARVLRAELAFARKRPEEAQRILKECVEAYPGELLPHQALAGAYLADGEVAQAAETVDLSIERFGDSPATRMLRAGLLVNQNEKGLLESQDLADALVELSEPNADWTSSENLNLAISLGRTQLSIGNGTDEPASNEAAQASINIVEANSQADDSIAAQTLIFDLAVLLGDMETMQQALARIVKIQGEGAIFHACKATELIAKADEAQAADDASAADGYYQQALYHLEDAAVERPAWSRIPQLKGNIKLLQAGLSQAAESDELLRAAVEDYLEAIRLGAQDPDVVSRTLQILGQQQRFVEADEIVRKLQQQNSELTPSVSLVASEVALRLDNPERAVAIAEQRARKSKQQSDWIRLAQIYSIADDDQKAEQTLKDAVRMDRYAAEGWVSLVLFFASNGKTDEAKKMIAKAAEVLPDGLASAAIAQCFYAVQDYRSAEESYRAAMERSPDDLALKEQFANFLLSIGEREQAIPVLEAIVDTTPLADVEYLEQDAKRLMWARRNLALVLASSDAENRIPQARRILEQNAKLRQAKGVDFGLDDDQRASVRINLQELRTLRDPTARRQLVADSISKLEGMVANQREFKLEDHFLLAQFYSLAGDEQRYRRKMLREVLPNGGSSKPEYVLNYLRFLESDGDPAAADWSRRLEELVPGSQEADTAKARRLFASQDYDRVLKLLEDRSQSATNSSSLTTNLLWAARLAESFAGALERQDQPSESVAFVDLATKLYERYAEEKPEEKPVLAAFRARQNELDAALDMLEQQTLAPEEAVRILRSALQAKDLSPDNCRRLVEKAEPLFESNLDNEDLGLTLGDLYGWMGDWEGATASYKKVLNAKPNSIPALNNMAMTLAFACKEPDLAMRAVQLAIKEVGETDYLLDTRGQVLLCMRNAELAEKDLRKALAVGQQRADRYFHLARALLLQKKVREASKAFEEARARGLSADLLHPMERALYHEIASRLTSE